MVEPGEIGALIILVPIGGLILLAMIAAAYGGNDVEIVNLIGTVATPIVVLAIFAAGTVALYGAAKS